MSEGKFKVYKAHKMMDYLEAHLTEWATELVTDHFGEDVENLTHEQIAEVIEQWEEFLEFEPFLAVGFRNVISVWENENDEYIV